MGKTYRQLTEQDRTFLQIMLDKGYTKVKIATVLGVHRSTVHRELRRNSVKYWYRPQVKYYYSIMAHQAYLKRRKKGLKLEKNPYLQDILSLWL